MVIIEIYYQSSDSITLSLYINGVLTDADAAPVVTITRLADQMVIVNGATATTAGTGLYKYILTTANNSNLGKFKVRWDYVVQTVANVKTDYYDVVVGYANAAQFRELYPSFAAKTNDEIYAKEKLARKIIDIFCNQNFGFENDLTRTVRGVDGNKLFLTKRIFNLTEVLLDSTGDDITADLEILDDYWLAPDFEFRAGFFIDIKRGLTEPTRFFRKQLKYLITGDWGWEAVPDNINLACLMLMNDYFCDTSLLREHGIVRYQLGEKELFFGKDLWGTTGNYDVDLLLADYSYVGVRMF